MASTNNTVEQKLKALYKLQSIDSRIDDIRITQGELPLEIKSLEDEVEGMKTRLEKYTEEFETLKNIVLEKKNSIVEANALIKKYKEQQDKVRNKREFEAVSKEVEFQELEIELSEKHINEANFKIEAKQESIDEAKVYRSEREEDLKKKKEDLDSIIKETKSEEDVLLKESAKAEKLIDERLIVAYKRIRGNAKNGLAVVVVNREACGGCFNKIPPQRQLDISQRKKIIVCEHCGRVLVDAKFDPNYKEPVEEVKPKKKRTPRKKKSAS